jgi:5-methylcytosine-specific restriction endonuclease McrA
VYKGKRLEVINVSFPVEYILSLFVEFHILGAKKIYHKRRKITIVADDGTNITASTNSERYILFHEKGVVCVGCGRVGTHFKAERNEDSVSYHFNLYSDDGMLFTKDHVVARSNGGKDRQSNYQVACYECNDKKSNNIENVLLNKKNDGDA